MGPSYAIMQERFHQPLKDIADRYGLWEVYAFGSRAREIAGRLQGGEPISGVPQSDVDMAVRTRPDKQLDPWERVRLTLDLEDLLGVPRVDLVILNEAEPFLALEIIRGELLYAQDPDHQARFELYVLRRAGDLLPFKRERIRMVMEEGAR